MSSPSANCSKRPLELSNDDVVYKQRTEARTLAESSQAYKRGAKMKGPIFSSGQDYPMTPETKAMRRLAQNREAAKISRQKKKAYVQELESSRIKLTQLEQKLQQDKAQGLFLGGAGLIGADQGPSHCVGGISSEANAFNMEYAKWLEDHKLRMGKLKGAVINNLSAIAVQLCVDDCIRHFGDFLLLKKIIVKEDVFHILSGTWKTPLERGHMWVGGVRPSDLIKMITVQIKPLSDPQIIGIFGLRTAMEEREESLNQSLSNAMLAVDLKTTNDIANYMDQMSAATKKLSTISDIVNKADDMRLEAIHHMYQMMTTRQASRSLMAIDEYFGRLQSLSNFWVTCNLHP